MSIIVQKYGGSSVADPERIKAVCDRIIQTVKEGYQVVVVVSAMGKTTDNLMKLAQAVSDQPNDRELDLLLATGEQVSIALLSMALQAKNQPAIALTGHQVRIVTEAIHNRARILHIEPEHVRSQLNLGKVVIIAGFQGVGINSGEITTLGRGGSDTSAVAIAAALQADLCEIYTDVPGILTTDPRLVPNAQMLTEITCDEMLELASLGAKVLHPRAVEIARNFGVKLAVRSSWLDQPGTVVTCPALISGSLQTLEVNRFVDGVGLDLDQVKIALLQLPDRPGVAAHLFTALADAAINVDLIIQSIHATDIQFTDIVFTVRRDQEQVATLLVHSLNLGAQEILIEANVAKISIVGAGIIGRPGVAAQMFLALAEAGINIQMISTSEIKVSCVVAAADSPKAIAKLQTTFNLADNLTDHLVEQNLSVASLASIVPVRGVALDRNQAQLAVRHVPDRPGVAAELFQKLGDRGVTVDMIIQSQPQNGFNNIAFTVPLSDLLMAESVMQQAAPKLGYAEVISDDQIAKVSIVGAGMISYPGVAACMFTALAQAQINIEMIATSEIKVSCVVRQECAETALTAIHAAFNLGGDRTISVPGIQK